MYNKPTLSWQFITFVTHNSRVSERMIDYNSSEFIDELSPFIYDNSERIIITQLIFAQCAKHNIKIAGINVLPDHVHMVIAASDIHDLDMKVQLIKGGSSFLFKRNVVLKNYSQQIWAQKYHLEQYKSENDLKNILHYINNNHFKHAEKWGNNLISEYENNLKPLIDKACVEINSIYFDE
jgi:REP element-mobilizing transposase RayT